MEHTESLITQEFLNEKHSMRGGNYRTNNSQRFHRTQRNKPVTERIRKLPNTVNTGSQADGMDFRELLLSHFSCSDCVTPWTVPGPSVHGILQARILEWVAVLFSRGPFGPRDRTRVSLCLLQWQVGSSPLAPPELHRSQPSELTQEHRYWSQIAWVFSLSLLRLAF